jgi:integrase
MHELQATGTVTLRQVWMDYQRVRALKPSTVDNYRKCIYRCIADWLDVPIALITKDMIEERHVQLSMFGGAQANLSMRILRALITFAAYKYDELSALALTNPVKRLSELRSWNRLSARDRIILPHQMPKWFESVLSLSDKPAVRDFLLVLILTGLRRNEASQLRWDTVNLEHRTLKIPDTKNGKPHELPLSRELYAILSHRRHNAVSRYVFPGRSPQAPLSRWSQTHRIVAQRSGIGFMLHDLRRTFITVADQLDIPDRLIKRLANHKVNDITERYIYRSVERLRAPMQAISDEIMRQAGLTDFCNMWEN